MKSKLGSSNKLQKKGAPRMKNQAYYYVMVLIPCVFLIIFCYVPMSGLIMAFQDFYPSKGIFGSEFVGFEHFEYMFSMRESYRVFRNTLVIAFGKIVVGTFASIVFSILLNEIRRRKFRKGLQTIVYLPHFLSWVILSAVVLNMLSVDGPINQMIMALGGESINFIGNNATIQPVLILTDVWKEFGYSSVVYLAALTAIDPGLYESATIDGASWSKLVWHVTIPGMLPIIMLMAAINLSSILNAGFDQVYNLYSSLVYERADILDTYVYRVGLISRQYGFGTAVGLLKSVVGIILMLGMNQVAKVTTDRKIF